MERPRIQVEKADWDRAKAAGRQNRDCGGSTGGALEERVGGAAYRRMTAPAFPPTTGGAPAHENCGPEIPWLVDAQQWSDYVWASFRLSS